MLNNDNIINDLSGSKQMSVLTTTSPIHHVQDCTYTNR